MLTPSDHDEVFKVFGNAVRARRLELGLSQEELAFRAHLSRSYITDIERGTRNVALRNIAKLANALEVDISRLFSGVEKSNNG